MEKHTPLVKWETRELLSLVRYDSRMEIAVGYTAIGEEFVNVMAHNPKSGVLITRAPILRRELVGSSDRMEVLQRALSGRMKRRGYHAIGEMVWVRHAKTAEALGVMRGLEMEDEREPEPNSTVLEGDMRTVALVPAMAEVLDNCRPDILCSLLSAFAINGGDEAREDPRGLVHSERELEIYLERPRTVWALDMDHTEALWALEEALSEALDEIAPDGCAYGTLEGDGACFGFWEVENVDTDL
jgi:hypothetical protein